ncbi:hypothetical protein K7W42_03750 [Deinococcus sp. HMF7604]|uniref:hypothetical protein n=1 Tax=Deinococcus betulae TaxID=2873312 RepID=UPI001CC9E137|nr:hypothetical protein [Deinococcus betulae]MBZ9749973.1 hypothetical protein [Deinococcus betulae]
MSQHQFGGSQIVLLGTPRGLGWVAHHTADPRDPQAAQSDFFYVQQPGVGQVMNVLAVLVMIALNAGHPGAGRRKRRPNWPDIARGTALVSARGRVKVTGQNSSGAGQWWEEPLRHQRLKFVPQDYAKQLGSAGPVPHHALKVTGQDENVHPIRQGVYNPTQKRQLLRLGSTPFPRIEESQAVKWTFFKVQQPHVPMLPRVARLGIGALA